MKSMIKMTAALLAGALFTMGVTYLKNGRDLKKVKTNAIQHMQNLQETLSSNEVNQNTRPAIAANSEAEVEISQNEEVAPSPAIEEVDEIVETVPALSLEERQKKAIASQLNVVEDLLD
mgnify:CR=1 FL=1